MPRCNGGWFKLHNWSKWKETDDRGSIMSQGPGVAFMSAEDREKLEWYRIGAWYVQERECLDCGLVQRQVQKVRA
jgi:hypothetical protein